MPVIAICPWYCYIDSNICSHCLRKRQYPSEKHNRFQLPISRSFEVWSLNDFIQVIQDTRRSLQFTAIDLPLKENWCGVVVTCDRAFYSWKIPRPLCSSNCVRTITLKTILKKLKTIIVLCQNLALYVRFTTDILVLSGVWCQVFHRAMVVLSILARSCIYLKFP